MQFSEEHKYYFRILSYHESSALQQKCHVLPENTRNARHKWLLEKISGKIGNKTRLNIFLEIVE